ncbi:hypothetical protein KJ359_010833 [Pestalotiopsis sp. 9143b]|nr:hypothetical protein KJ359_010833 [Pestalotiopsis sp. 9143b]
MSNNRNGSAKGDIAEGDIASWIPENLRQYLPAAPVAPVSKTAGIPPKPKQQFKCPKPDCRLPFDTQADLRKHQKTNCHWRCVECKNDYLDEEALTVHNQSVHREVQDLECPGCEEKFISAAHLVGHIEDNRCSRIFPSTLHKSRQKVIQIEKAKPNYLSLTEAIDMVGLNMKDDDSLKPKLEADPLKYQVSSQQHFPELGKELKDYRNGYSAEPDLLTGEPLKKLTISPAVKVENQWEKGKDQALFPDGGSVARPSPGQLEQLTAGAPSTQDISPNKKVTDPDENGFNSAVFYHSILKKFVCPHAPKCKAKFPSAKGLVAHLKSTAHKEAVAYKCPRCLRDYKTMASAMAHAENATKTCNVRETADFGQFVTHITGGMLNGLNGPRDRLKDGSPRYVIPKRFYESLPFPTRQTKAPKVAKKSGPVQ